MKEGPDIARVAALIGDPARANILSALMTGKALTASELAREAGITAQTASSHLGKLSTGGLIVVRAQGRHRYYGLASDDVAHTLEALMGLAAQSGHLRTRTGPADPALREARVCYNHLAGAKGIHLFRSLRAGGALQFGAKGLTLTETGAVQMERFGIDMATLTRSRTPMCRECLDWSARESHLAGTLGRAILTRLDTLGWTTREPDSRVVRFSQQGTQAFLAAFPIP